MRSFYFQEDAFTAFILAVIYNTVVFHLHLPNLPWSGLIKLLLACYIYSQSKKNL